MNNDKYIKEELREYSKSISEKRNQKLYAIAQTTAKQDAFLNKPFYIVFVPTYARKVAPELEPEDFFFVRHSCPTPAYNQHVFKYHPESSTLEFLWSIPKKALYYHMWNNRARYVSDPTWKSRTSFVIAMETGELLKWVKKENGEKPDAIITIKKEAEA